VTPEQARIQTEATRLLSQIWENRKAGMTLEKQLRELRATCRHAMIDKPALQLRICRYCQYEDLLS
jgi:hypothetical protein